MKGGTEFMLEKKLLNKGSPVSYSHFLHPQNHSYTLLEEARNASIDREIFKRSISQHYQQIYNTQKWKNWFYRCVFVGFGLLFIALGVAIFFKTINFACGFYFKNGDMLKNCLNIVCFFLAGIAFAIGYHTQPEKEAIQYLIDKIERNFHHPEKHLQIEFNTIIANISQGNSRDLS